MLHLSRSGIISGAGGGIGATLFEDTFTDTDATALTDHTPDTGIGWTNVVASGGQSIVSNALKSASGTWPKWICDDTAADCTISSSAMYHAGSSDNPGIIFRYVDSANYWYTYVDNGGIYLSSVVGGSVDVNDYNDSLGSNNATARKMDITLNGTSIKVWVDDTLLFNITNSSHLTSVKHGVTFYSTDAWIADFKVAE